MPFDWKEICKNWAYGLSIPYTPAETVKAFNRVEKIFGSNFFAEYNWLRGDYIVTLIVDLNKILEETEKGNSKLPPNGEIVQKIKKMTSIPQALSFD